VPGGRVLIADGEPDVRAVQHRVSSMAWRGEGRAIEDGGAGGASAVSSAADALASRCPSKASPNRVDQLLAKLRLKPTGTSF
jgi:hypothetical protein